MTKQIKKETRHLKLCRVFLFLIENKLSCKNTFVIIPISVDQK